MSIIDLGELRFKFQPQHECSIRSKAILESMQNSATQSDTVTLEGILARKVWVARNTSLTLFICIRLGRLYSLSSAGIAIQRLVQHAPLWSHLCLRPSIVVRAVATRDHCLELDVTLTPSEHAPEYFAQGPPQNFPSVCLKAVNLEIAVDHLEPSDVAEAINTPIDQLCSATTSGLFDDESVLSEDSMPLSDLLYSEDMSPILNDPTSGSDKSDDLLRNDGDPSRNDTRISCISTYALSAQHLKIIDAAIRLAFCSNLKCLVASDITLLESLSFTGLVELAPSIFCPGYMEAIASQAVHVPNITSILAHPAGQAGSQCEHALWSMLIKGNESRILSVRLAALQIPNDAHAANPVDDHDDLMHDLAAQSDSGRIDELIDMLD